MKSTLSAIVALAATADLASASWSGASAFSCPSNTNNECNTQQSSGFNWDSLNLGSFSSYGDFSFSGYSCAGSFGGGKKRDVLTGRSFQDKCITGQASTEKSSSPSFGCGSSSSVKEFSVTEFQVSTEFDCDLEFHFAMPNGSNCKQKASCSKDGTVVKNSQCGGAKSVTVVYPSQTTGTGTSKTACSFGVHSMSFDCSSASSTVIHSTKTKSTSSKSTPASTIATTTSISITTSEAKPTTSNIPTPETTPASSSTSTSAIETSPVPVPETTLPSSSTSSTLGFFNSTSSEVPSTSVVETTTIPQITTSVTSTQLIPSTVYSTFVSTVISCGPEVTNCPASSTVLSTVSVPVSTTNVPITYSASTSSAEGTPAASTSLPPVDVVTVIISTSTTVCPVTLTHVTQGTTSLEVATTTSTILSTITSTVCTKCQAASTTSAIGEITSSSTTTSASGPVETAPCPDVLPSCLNTWLFSEGCSSNTDSDCYCPSSAFVTKVFDCLAAYGADDAEIASAQTYFQGICAPHIPSNPAIVTGAYPVSSAPAYSASAVPATTIQVLTTLTVPCVESTGISAGNTIPSSSVTTIISTQLTVPQVIFTTVTGSTTASAELVAGTPASAVAVTTPTYTGVPIPASSTLAVSKTSNGTVSATATPSTVVSTGGASQMSIAFGTSFAAIFIAIFAL